jgi:hypothetical protein
MMNKEAIQQQAEAAYPKKYISDVFVRIDITEEVRDAFTAGAEWMQASSPAPVGEAAPKEGDYPEASNTDSAPVVTPHSSSGNSVEQDELIDDLMDKRVEKVMREAFRKTTIWDKTIYEGENAYYLSRKQIAEDLLNKYTIIPKSK